MRSTYVEPPSSRRSRYDFDGTRVYTYVVSLQSVAICTAGMNGYCHNRRRRAYFSIFRVLGLWVVCLYGQTLESNFRGVYGDMPERQRKGRYFAFIRFMGINTLGYRVERLESQNKCLCGGV